MLGKIPLGKIPLVFFVGYFAYEIYGMFELCQPVSVDPSHENAVQWDLVDEQLVNIHVYFSTQPQVPDVNSKELGSQTVDIATIEAVKPNGEEPSEVKVEDFRLPDSFLRNGTVYLHTVVTKVGGPSDREIRVIRTGTETLSRYVLQQDRKIPTRFLLNETVEQAMARMDLRPISSIPGVIEVGFVTEQRIVDGQNLASKGLEKYVRGRQLELPLHINTLISPRDEYLPLEPNKTLSKIEVRFRRIGLPFWTLQHLLSMSFDEAEKTYGLNSYDVDSFKQMAGGSSPWKLIIVYSVSILHLIFEWLSTSNEIQFWRSKTSFEGLSSTTVTLQVFSNIISLLYVVEVRQSKMVMYFIGLRLLMHVWKLRKMTTFRRCQGFPFFEWVNREGVMAGTLEEVNDLADAERRCMRYLLGVLLPLAVAFGLYRLFTTRFRSWYSWVILTLAVCSQTAGFVVMTPQVFMNYRMKSVDHLPWRALTYQAMNTFIDDIFMLCIRMPEVQKYSVFRDDLVFVVCCIQRWMYKGRRMTTDPAEPLPEDSAVPNEEHDNEEKKTR
eukprot:TRINITY_DN61287_c0_g1_i1.p1 TRINITY_DN61287_c0_g1~~TRINITY_DN61287_c0_g1_i1.p1  ORF type:complete len:553 (+),score=89.03 TRINITY_DN61287_c0_g1_i1:140-1798(+)